MQGLIQDHPLLISSLLEHAEREHGAATMVSRHSDGEIVRQTYVEFAHRARRLASALITLGVEPGRTLATLAWNTGRHMEIYYAVSGIGAVCHPVNPRLFEPEIAFILNDASDRVMFVDLDLAPIAERCAREAPSLRAVVVLCRQDQLPPLDLPEGVAVHAYETLLAAADPIEAWPVLDERSAAMLCYTSGTTGRSKGVLYSHRAILLHTYAICAADGFGCRAVDTVMPAVPMFHVMAWGFPYAAAATGFNLVLPGNKLDGAFLHQWIQQEGVTVAVGIPILWLGLGRYLEETGAGVGQLERIINGGAALPPVVVESFRLKHGVRVQHAWGMTECGPVAGVNSPTRSQAPWPSPQYDNTQRRQGRSPFGISVKVVGEDGEELARDGVSVGPVKLKGYWVLSAYFNMPDVVLDGGGWFDTGDIGSIDADGFLLITDRSKDAVKSGGEWISSTALENLALAHPCVLEAAVLAKPDALWDERPLLICVLKPGARTTEKQLRAFYDGKVAKWWIPDEVLFTDELPRVGSGKLNKVELRRRFLGMA
jgi:fatty-acyl-CoA synthase